LARGRPLNDAPLARETSSRQSANCSTTLETMLRPSSMPTPVARVEVIFERLVREAQAQGGIRADLKPSDVAGALTGAYFAAFSRWAAAGSEQPAALGSELEAVLKMLFEGIAGPNYR